VRGKDNNIDALTRAILDIFPEQSVSTLQTSMLYAMLSDFIDGLRTIPPSDVENNSADDADSDPGRDRDE
jgi:hypothetical protein